MDEKVAGGVESNPQGSEKEKVETLAVEIDSLLGTITIEGVRYSFDFFKELGGWLPLRTPFELVSRDNGTIAIRRLVDGRARPGQDTEKS